MEYIQAKQLKELSNSYDRDTCIKRSVFSLNKGDFTVILGPSGSGKPPVEPF